MFRGLASPIGREIGLARQLINRRFLILATVGYVGVCFLLWRPLPLALPMPARFASLGLGALLYFPGLALYLWGMRSLGRAFMVSSVFGVRLLDGQSLITHGPYAFSRHPMYLGLIAAGLGGLLIFQTWATVFFFLSMLSLILRARREEQALAQTFGQEWEAYARRVPGWFPRIQR